MKNKFFVILLTLILLQNCDDVNNSLESGVSGEWLIPKGEIFDGGPGKDGIPALQNPEMIPVSSINYLNDNDLVIVITFDGIVNVYPHPILDWHEIINSGIGNHKYAITYCPLTGSAIAWNRILNGSETTFGVSGLLYNTNLIPYDRLTNSNWSQMSLKSVNGQLIGREAETYQVIETSWSTLKQMFPNAKVVSTNTGVSRNYGAYPYGDYRTNDNSLLFPVNNNDNRLPAKDRVFGIIYEGGAVAYALDRFGSTTKTYRNFFNGKPAVIVGNASQNFAAAFFTILDDETELSLTAVQNNLPVILEDTEGNSWDIFGNAVEGPRTGTKLNPVNSFIAYWFAWAAFYPSTEINNN